MFGIGKKASEEPPKPPTAEEILEDLAKASPDDVAFTSDIAELSSEIGVDSYVPRSFVLKSRFQQTKNLDNLSDSEVLYEKVIEYNQNVEKLQTLRAKLAKNIEDLVQTREDLTEELAKTIQSHSQAVDLHVQTNDGAHSGSAF